MSVRQRRSDSKGGADSSAKDENARKKPFEGRYNPKLNKNRALTGENSVLPHAWWARIVMAASIAFIVYWTARPAITHTVMAKQGEVLDPKRFQNSLCAPSFKREIENLGNKGCLPGKCGRVVFDGLVRDEEVHGLISLAKKGLSKGGSSGGASILDLHSGALSQGEQFVNVYALYPELFAEADFEVYRRVKERVKAAVVEHFGLQPDSLFLSHPTFFSRITADPAKTIHDEYWHVHVDKETYGSFHFTSLLYLTDYGIDFKGGSFVFVDNHDKLNRTIQPRSGRVSAFTSGPENKHHVEKVTWGTRYALTMGFTCDESKSIPDPGTKT